jgi:hypothetical protein
LRVLALAIAAMTLGSNLTGDDKQPPSDNKTATVHSLKKT